MKNVFLVSGKLQSGKNQFAEYLGQVIQLNEGTVTFDLFAKDVKEGSRDDFKKLYEYINSKVRAIRQDLMLLSCTCQFTIEPHLNDLETKEDNFFEDKTDLTRILLQLYGTDIFRKRIDDDYWVKKLISRVQNSEADNIIVTDVRFPNEIELFKGTPGINPISIRIERKMVRKEDFQEHESETSLDEYKFWDFIVENNGTLEDLYGSAETINNEVIKDRILS